jgi:hypothetical protein
MLEKVAHYPSRHVNDQYDLENSILGMVMRIPTPTLRRTSAPVGVSRMQVWGFHMKTSQAVQPADYTALVEFCHWLLGNVELHTKLLFTVEAKFNRDGTTHTQNSQVWSFDVPDTSIEIHFRDVFQLTFLAVLLEAKP